MPINTSVFVFFNTEIQDMLGAQLTTHGLTQRKM